MAELKKIVEADSDTRPMCGLIMPISAIDGCSEAHWSDVHEILSDAADEAGFKTALVSNGDETGIIQKRIIQNLYDNPIVVCDVSGKNPNVMFELGIRLAFDKPTIIVKDDKTAYSFDTSPIEHLVYPRDLRFSKIVDFKETLAEKIQATHKKATEDKNYTTFLKHFGEFTVAKLDKKEISGQEYILEELRAIRLEMNQRGGSGTKKSAGKSVFDYDVNLCLSGKSAEEVGLAIEKAVSSSKVKDLYVKPHNDHEHLVIDLSTDAVNVVEFAKDIGLAGRARNSKRHKRLARFVPKQT